MMLTPIQNQALYPVLQHYTGSKIVKIYKEGDRTIFNTGFGQNGEILEDVYGDWKIIIEEEEVGSIEKDVFNTLVNPDKKSTLESYIQKLTELLFSENVKYRSRILISQTLKVLEGYIINSDFVPKDPVKVGAFYIFGYKNNKFMYCLN